MLKAGLVPAIWARGKPGRSSGAQRLAPLGLAMGCVVSPGVIRPADIHELQPTLAPKGSSPKGCAPSKGKGGTQLPCLPWWCLCVPVPLQPDKALLWTDGRYFLQAEQQLQTPQWQLMKMREPEAGFFLKKFAPRVLLVGELGIFDHPEGEVGACCAMDTQSFVTHLRR